MKNRLIKTGSLLSIVLLFAYCTSNDRETDVLDNIQEARQTLTSVESYYLGQNAEGDVYSLRLMSQGITGVDYITSNDVISKDEIKDNNYKGNGYIIFIDSLFTGNTTGETVFPAGTFDVAKSNITYVVLHNSSAASAAEKYPAKEGTVTVTESGGIYTIIVDAVNLAGAKLKATYSGKIEVAPTPVYTKEPLAASEQSFVIDDVRFESENIDADDDGKMDFSLAKLTLTGKNALIVIDEIVGQKYVIGAEPKRPEVGAYTLSEWTYEDKTFTPGEIYQGKLTGSYAWLLSNPETPSFSKMWYFVEAQMVVEESDTAYSIVVTATSAYGSTITATYTDKKE